MKENASRGFYNGGSTPFGYKRIKVNVGESEKTKLASNQTESDIIKKIFKIALDGKGGKEIAKSLTADGIRTKLGKHFSTNSINHILRNEVYTGALVWRCKNNGYGSSGKKASAEIIRIPDCHEALVSKEDFDTVQQFLTNRRPVAQHPRTISSQYLLSGLLHCGKCGSAMTGCWAKSGQYFYYECVQHQKKGKEACDCRLVSKEKLESFVIDRVRENILTDENIKQLVEFVNDELIKNSGLLEKQLSQIGQQMGQNEGRLAKLYTALESGKIDIEDLAPRIKELRTQQKELEAKQNILLDQMNDKNPAILNLETVQKYASSLKELLCSSAFIEQKSFLRSFIKRVEMNGPEVTIDYTMPLPKKPLTTTEEVLRIEGIGSPNELINRTIRAVFQMPVDKFNHNLIKISKQQHRNPIYLAKEWRNALDDGKYDSLAAIARHFNITRARVTQIMNLLELSPEAISLIASLGDQISSPIVSERRLRSLLGLSVKKQIQQINKLISKNGSSSNPT